MEGCLRHKFRMIGFPGAEVRKKHDDVHFCAIEIVD